MLSNRNHNGTVVCVRVDLTRYENWTAATGRDLTYRADAVDTGRETTHNGDRENIVYGRGVDALEEGKHLRVQGSSRVNCRE
jgi:hypothetical protein